MKAFVSGFLSGIKNCTLMCAAIFGVMGALYGSVKGLEYLIETYGEYVVVVCSVLGLILLFGVFEGLWARHQYNKWAKRLVQLEDRKREMTSWDYEYEVNKAKGAMKAILNHDYSRLVR